MKYTYILAGSFLAICTLTGCGALQEKKYTDEQLGNLAKLEIYEAGTDTLLKTIEDEETLYQYNNSRFSSTSWEDKYDFEDDEAYEAYEMKRKELKETAENAGEAYYIAEYKKGVAKFGGGKPVKMITITLYKDTNILKWELAGENVINMLELNDFLTFYEEMTEEEHAFYMSMIEE